MSALRTEDPATSIAMARCLTARTLATRAQAFRPTVRHPRTCGWCDYPLEELQAAVIEFNNWAEFNDRLGTSGHHVTRTFAESPQAQQEAAIVAAQGLLEEETHHRWQPHPAEAGMEICAGCSVSRPAEPLAPVAAPAPDAEEEISWLA